MALDTQSSLILYFFLSKASSYQSYGIVEKLAGTITVENKVDVGTVFAITLPVRRNSF